jgi:site-specific recombinase XerD
LRREGGSRLLEGGVPEHYVQRFLDHANLSTASPADHGQVMQQALKQHEFRRISKELARSDEDMWAR